MKKSYKAISFEEVFNYAQSSDYNIYTDLYIDNLGSKGVTSRKEKVNLINIRINDINAQYFQIGDETYLPSKVSDWDFYIINVLEEINLYPKYFEIGKVYEGQSASGRSFTSDRFIKKEDGKIYHVHSHELADVEYLRDEGYRFREMDTTISNELLKLLSVLRYNWIVPGKNMNFYNQKHPRENNHLNTKDVRFKIRTHHFIKDCYLAPLLKYCIDTPEINIAEVLEDNGYLKNKKSLVIDKDSNNEMIDEIEKYIGEKIEKKLDEREYCESWEVEKYDAIVEAYEDIYSKIRKVVQDESK